MFLFCYMRLPFIAPAVDCGHYSLGKVQFHAPATNIPHYNYTKLSQRSATPDLSRKTTKVKRNKSSSAADAYLYCPESRKLLSERKFQLNRSNPNLLDCSDRRRVNILSGNERRSGSQPSLLTHLRAVVTPVPAPAPTPRSTRSSTWCCGTFVKQLTKSHHFD